MKTDNEIMVEARSYWEQYVGQVATLITWYALETRPMWRGMAPNPDRVPDFSLDLTKKRGAIINEMLGLDALDFEQFFASSTVKEVFGNGNLYALLVKARDQVIRIHKDARMMLASKITGIRKLEKSLLHRPESNKSAWLESIENLEYLHRFSGALINYLEKEWPVSFGFDGNLNKDTQKHPCWNTVLLHLYRKLTTDVIPPISLKADVYRLMVDMLQAVYPSIWCCKKHESKSDLANKIKSRTERLLKKSND